MAKSSSDAIDALTVLRAYVTKFPTLTKAAQSLGISQPFLSDILLGNRRISPRILEKLGLEQIVRVKRQPKERSHETV